MPIHALIVVKPVGPRTHLVRICRHATEVEAPSVRPTPKLEAARWRASKQPLMPLLALAVVAVFPVPGSDSCPVEIKPHFILSAGVCRVHTNKKAIRVHNVATTALVPGQTIYDQKSRVCKFEPSAPLDPGATYRVTLRAKHVLDNRLVAHFVQY